MPSWRFLDPAICWAPEERVNVPGAVLRIVLGGGDLQSQPCWRAAADRREHPRGYRARAAGFVQLEPVRGTGNGAGLPSSSGRG
jgi:hypothetical protein